jgi:hypothetical protein
MALPCVQLACHDDEGIIAKQPQRLSAAGRVPLFHGDSPLRQTTTWTTLASARSHLSCVCAVIHRRRAMMAL